MAAPQTHKPDPVLTWLNQHLNPLAGPVHSTEKAGAAAGGSVVHAVQDVGHATVATGEFLAKLSDPNTWIRGGEILVGVICIAVGLSAMTKANPVAKATKTAAKAAVL